MKKIKYQIFVSSTYEDLKEERDVLIKAILEMGHIPVGMEMFSAGDEEQWKIIQKQIDDCDYYLIVVAFRYGSMDGDISYTEKEYDYALSKGIPALGFVINDGVSWPASNIDKDALKVEKLNALKDKIKKKMVSFWSDKNDLYGRASIAIMKQFTTNPRVGWVQADQAVGPEVLQEMSRLSKENSDLKEKIARLQSDTEPMSQLLELEQKKMKLGALPSLKAGGMGYNGSMGDFSIAIMNKGEVAIIDNYINNSEEVTIENIPHSIELEKGEDKKIKGYSNGLKHIKDCSFDIDIHFHDKLGNKYISKIEGTFMNLRVTGTKEG